MDRYYLIFVLGYDLLQKELYGLPCDYAFSICCNIINKFYRSDEISDYSKSTYDALREFIKNNKNEIDEIIEILR